MSHSIYKGLVAPSHINCVAIENAVIETAIKARNIYGDAIINNIGDVRIEFFDKGRNAANAILAIRQDTKEPVGFLQFSMHLIIKNLPTMIKQLVPHEYAHLICMSNGWDMGHGADWKEVCISLGGNGERQHNLTTIDGRRKNVYEALCDEGSSYWLTGQQMRMAASTGIEVRNASGRQFTLTKKSLTGNIKKL
jgi:predicted SprT family Zn-dependent metalloprotease